MAERLGVNIFSGVLPSSYTFIDDCSDISKWSADSPPDITKANGEAYGYIGKGMNLEIGAAGVGGRINRFLVGAANPGNVFFGGLIRPNLLAFRAEVPATPADISRYLTPLLEIPGPIGSGIAYELFFTIGTYLNPVDIYNVVFFDGGLPATTYRFDNTGGIMTTDQMPWFRFIALVQNNRLVSFTINAREILTAPITLTTTPWPANTPQIVLTAIKIDADAVAPSWDIDQLWLSETEYRV